MKFNPKTHKFSSFILNIFPFPIRFINYALFLIVSLIFFLFIVCEKNFSSLNKKIPPSPGIDTTSHNIIWEIDTIGIYPSFLRDVYTIDENNVWAVGKINESGGPYNAVHWDGQQWELKRFVQANGNTILSIRGLWYFSENNIWLAAGSIYHWNGMNTTLSYLRDINTTETVESLWASSPANIYGVGNAGLIVHYDGQNWQRLDSGTDIKLTDIWSSAHGTVIWVCGFQDNRGSVLLRNTGNGFEKVVEITSPGIPHPPNQITHIFQSLWSDTPDSIYLGAIGRVYIAPQNTSGFARELFWWDYENEPGYPPATEVIRGNAANDLFVAGFNRFIAHYNGNSWRFYPEVEGSGSWLNISCLENAVFLAGSPHGRAILARGYRQ